MIVTNIKGTLKTGKEQTGFYMNGYEVSNLLDLPKHLKEGWDFVGIFTGHGLVRVGKSTKCFQTASFCAWLLAGGRIDMELVDYGNKKTWKVNKITNPKKKLHWSLKENVVFSAQDLQTRAHQLYNKYGKNQIIVYDEGREGLDAKRAMENLNKIMEDFFQECGFMGHIIFIVLPSFFKLSEDYAVSRSVFLIDCLRDKKKKRGFYNFYDERQKEWLYFLGKKRIGITFKYDAASETFWGRFSSWFPFDRVEYETMKAEALKKRRRTARQLNWKKQRDALIYLYKTKTEESSEKIAEEITVTSGFRISRDVVDNILRNITGKFTDTS